MHVIQTRTSTCRFQQHVSEEPVERYFGAAHCRPSEGSITRAVPAGFG